MSCSSCDENVNPCQEQTYEDCGCLNPTTFKCTDYTGTDLSTLDIVKGDDGNTVLEKIETFASEVSEAKGKVMADSTDECPQSLVDKIEAGLNISVSVVGTGCDKKLRIDASEGGVAVDTSVRVSGADQSSGFLTTKLADATYLKKTIVNSGSNEQLKIDVVPSTLISKDSGNALVLGNDGKFKILLPTATDSTSIVPGSGVEISGDGSSENPYVISTNSSVYALRNCFDGTWKNLTLVDVTNPNVVKAAGQPKFRIRHDGAIEFKGSLTFNVAFGTYQSGNRTFTVTIGNVPTTCLTAGEQDGIVDLKNVNYIDAPQVADDQTVQMYGYTIRKNAQNIQLVFQSAFTNATTKTIVVHFDGAVSHPNI